MKMNLILRDIDSHIVDKIDNLAKQKKISRNECGTVFYNIMDVKTGVEDKENIY